MKCCDQDGWLQALKWARGLCEFFGLHRWADRISIARVRGIVLRHPHLKAKRVFESV